MILNGGGIKMNKFILILMMSIMTINVSALDFRDIDIDLVNGKTLTWRCLNEGFSYEFCTFVSMSFIWEGDKQAWSNMVAAGEMSQEEAKTAVDNYLNNFVCPAYKDMSSADRFSVPTITIDRQPYFGNDFYRSLCY